MSATRAAARARGLAAARLVILLTSAVLTSTLQVFAATICPEKQDTQQKPKDLAVCARLEQVVRKPSALRLDEYEKSLDEYFGNLCYRNRAGGWKVDKRVRDTGPWIGTYRGGRWHGTYNGTHAPVLVWYSPEMYAWLAANRPSSDSPAAAQPVPDGAIMVKEMYTPPASACAAIDPDYLLPTENSTAVMVRDSTGSHDGWFWGWWGGKGSGWKPDWPAASSSPYPAMGFGQYCTNCHASAKDNQTFAALKNIKGEQGDPLVFLSQNFFLDPSWQPLHERIAQSSTKTASDPNDPPYNPAFTSQFSLRGQAPTRADVGAMPPETYDNVWMKAGKPAAASQFVTSDQCLGCHSAGGTGLQYDMTQPGPGNKLINISPYGNWRGSPMGLAGRDPIFFAQLASETESFHPDSPAMVEDTCLGCHGIMGQRQLAIDRRAETGACGEFQRKYVDAVPFPSEDNPFHRLANYGALARDGISCAACHRMVLGEADTAKYRDSPQNQCVEQRQQAINPGLSGFARTVTGNFLTGPPDAMYGPFPDPKKKSMKHALGIDPEHNKNVTSSELCGSCHTVHLAVRHRGKTIDHVYEQTTYPEWAFSAYRTGTTPDGSLPQGGGPQAQSCQGCHMPNKDPRGNLYRSKIAAIQEYSNFPQAEHTLPPEDLDLPLRSGFGRHTLVGLNVFLLKMAWQFPDILGIRRTDPMLSDMGIESIATAENAMLDQAVNKTASLHVTDIATEGGKLSARVTVINRVGHKFPSGVGFRRAFLEFNVLDKDGKSLWSSGKTNGAGVIVDQNGAPIPGELWWGENCSSRIDPDARIHQPHYEEVTRQDQAQIYQELVSAPPDVDAPTCGAHAQPEGRLTTSFLSICAKVKDNRLLPDGFLGIDDRVKIAANLGANRDMADDTSPVGTGNDPDYLSGGRDSLWYRVPLADLRGGQPFSVQATLYYQATPPFYLQDRFCTANTTDTKRLYYLAGKLELGGFTQDWKLRTVTSGPVLVP
jgi:Cytochrome P460